MDIYVVGTAIIYYDEEEEQHCTEKNEKGDLLESKKDTNETDK